MVPFKANWFLIKNFDFISNSIKKKGITSNGTRSCWFKPKRRSKRTRRNWSKKREQVIIFCILSTKLSFKFFKFLVSDELETKANEYWNKFYSIHENKFFKDRNWLFTEFPELLFDSSTSTAAVDDNQRLAILEVGCGVGNTIFPIIRSNKYVKSFEWKNLN